jgi:hypothetical protein
MFPKVRRSTILFAIGALVSTLCWTLLHVHSKISSQPRTIATTSEPQSIQIPAEEPALCRNIYKTVCQGSEQARRDPTGLVRPDIEGERIVVSMYKEIIDKHPDWTPAQIDDELVRTVFTPERRGRIEAAFHWVQNRIEHFIDSQPDHVFNAREKKLLKQRVHSTILEIPPPASLYADEPDLLTKNDVFYERTADGTLRMRVGGAYLFTAKSWFNLVFTMGHELGHSIDPCEVRSARLSFPAYDRLTACFLKTGLVATSKTRQECDEDDQLSETFADWMGAQITAEALKTFATEYHGAQLVSATANAVRDLCEQDDSADLDTITHPSPKVRIERIFGNQPEVRSVLGCFPIAPPLAPYCGFDSDVSGFIPKKASPL